MKKAVVLVVVSQLPLQSSQSNLLALSNREILTASH